MAGKKLGTLCTLRKEAKISSLPLTLEFTHCYGDDMVLPNWKIGRALGIPIHLHASWFAVFFFVTWSLATDYLPDTLPGLSAPRYWGMGGIAALLLFLSVLLHELGHSYVDRKSTRLNSSHG